MKFTVGKKITIRVTSYIIKNVKMSSGAVRKLIEFKDKSGNNYVWGVSYNTPFPDEGVKYVSAKIQGIKDTEDGQIIILTGAKDITVEKEEQLAKRRAKAAAKRAEKNTTKDGDIPKEEPKEVEQPNDLPPTVGGDNPNDTAPAAQAESEETVNKGDLNSAEAEAVNNAGGKTEEPKETETPIEQSAPATEPTTEKNPEPAKPLSWQSFGISDKKYLKLTESYIRKMYEVFNDAYFNGELTLNGIRVIPYGAIRHKAGYVLSGTRDRHINYGLGPTDIAPRDDFMLDVVKEFCIGEKRNAPKRTEKSWCEIILHEMIHVYQHLVLRRSGLELEMEDRTAHGPTFTVKMKEINEKGDWDITVTDDKVGGVEISDSEAKDIQENYVVVAFNASRKSKVTKEAMSAAVLVPKDKLSTDLNSITMFHSDVEVYEIHNAASVSKIKKMGEINGYQCFPLDTFSQLEKRGDITKLNVNDFVNTTKPENDVIANNYYLFVARRGARAKKPFAIALVPKERIERLKNDLYISFYSNNKLYYINNGTPFKDLKPYKFDGSFYVLSNDAFANLRKFLGEEIKLTESVNINDLKPELKQIYETIFYESNPDEDIFDSYVDENHKVVEENGQKVLYSLNF